jgi:hypothetical protein
LRDSQIARCRKLAESICQEVASIIAHVELPGAELSLVAGYARHLHTVFQVVYGTPATRVAHLLALVVEQAETEAHIREQVERLTPFFPVADAETLSDRLVVAFERRKRGEKIQSWVLEVEQAARAVGLLKGVRSSWSFYEEFSRWKKKGSRRMSL